MYSLNEVRDLLAQLPQSDLAMTLALAGDWDPEVMGKIVQMKAAFVRHSETQDADTLYEIIEFAINIDGHVKWNRCSPYCQILHVAHSCLKRLVERGDRDLAIRIAETVVEKATIASEALQEPDYWEMSICDITKWKDSLG